MSDLSWLQALATVEAKSLERAQAQIDDARQLGHDATSIDCSGFRVEAIDVLARALAGRGYRVAKTVGVTDYRHSYPLIRVSW